MSRTRWTRRIGKHLQVKLLSAAGLKTEVARQISPDLAATFTDLLLEMSAMKNQGSACVARKVVEDLAVLDVFNLLRWLPRDYFFGKSVLCEASATSL